jgi:aspartyl/asparaginyl beta-hydroxylase (cupin superfamily)
LAHIGKVVEQMRAGGYFDRIMDGGSELSRVKHFLLACAGERVSVAPGGRLQRPDYPCFPGLQNRPWHDPQDFEAVRILEAVFDDIRAEAMQLHQEAEIDYSAAAHPWRSWKQPWTLLRPDAAPRTWTVYLLHHMGVRVEDVNSCCPKTLAVVNTLPRACTAYAWGDFVFSAMNAGSHLRAHCSIDNLRVRIHLGLVVPEGCSLRVGTETRSWEAGRCLVFEDSFEHEVWNRSSQRRIVLIADLWHPDLSEVEIDALTAGFRKSEVRRIFMRERLGMTQALPDFLPRLEGELARQDDEPCVRAYWGDSTARRPDASASTSR